MCSGFLSEWPMRLDGIQAEQTTQRRKKPVDYILFVIDHRTIIIYYIIMYIYPLVYIKCNGKIKTVEKPLITSHYLTIRPRVP